ncbi:MAG: hypothetical protein CM15mP84_01140 [Cellvibrionales bacterium]|nr:MAG: hypothetical protein CM15mP84_01140 [Cellvibrionales bacterium]
MAEYLSAVGIVVGDLELSAGFYERAWDDFLRTITLPTMKEIVLGFEGTRSAAVLLMKYTDGTQHENNKRDGKLVFYVNNVSETIEKLSVCRLLVEREPEVSDLYGGAIIGFARDPDGHRLELIQKPPKN